MNEQRNQADEESCNQAREQAAAVLEAIRDRRISFSEFRAEWPEGGDQLLGIAYQVGQHYLDDADIRAKDERYEDWQERQISEAIAMLHTGVVAEDVGFAVPHMFAKRRSGAGRQGGPHCDTPE